MQSLLLLQVLSTSSSEHVLPSGVGLATRGKALRLRFGDDVAFREVSPLEPDADFTVTAEGIVVEGVGSLLMSEGQLHLRDAVGKLLAQGGGHCDALRGRRPEGGQVLRQAKLDEGACCEACGAEPQCTDWSVSGGTCSLIHGATGWGVDEAAAAGRPRSWLVLSTSGSLYGRGAGPSDAEGLLSRSSQGSVANRETYVPYFYSTDGYGALGLSNVTHFNQMAVRYHFTGSQVAWAWEGSFQLFLMPASSLAAGTRAYYSLTGRPPVPPRHTLGFMACRWGWPDRRYLEETIQSFRSRQLPLDSVILDFEWFANTSDYGFSGEGEVWYDDFAWNPKLFPEPMAQLEAYLKGQQVYVGGIRKPRLGNRELLQLAKRRGWIAPEGGPETYAKGRWLRFSDHEMQSWYSDQMKHYVDSGISYWWNDEGENFYYTYHEWNLAERRLLKPQERFFSLNRAFTPGMARLGTAIWTGDVNAKWEDLRKTPGTMLNWALAGAPYVACDIGGFYGNASSQLLARWYQVGSFMPLMRTHSHRDALPHWPWLYADSDVMREALVQRYRLLPYHYSLAHRLWEEGELFIRPLVMDFPDDPEVANLTTQWMDGSILVAPVLSEDSNVEIYLPRGLWHPFDALGQVITGPWRETRKVGLSMVPAFVRLGTVLALAPATLSGSQALPGGPLEVQVYAGADGRFKLVEDDGHTVANRTRRTIWVWNDRTRELAWSVEGEAPKAGAFESFYLCLFDHGRHHSQVKLLGTGGRLKMATTRALRQVQSYHFHVR